MGPPQGAPEAGATPYDDRVRALPAGSTRAHARVRLSEGVRDRFWWIPAVLVTSGVVLGVVVSRPDLVGLPDGWGFGREVRTTTAETLLQVMASSMLTFVGVVFTITLVGLQLASSQLSPRVIRTFVRSGVTKTAFGVFLASFAFALTALAFDNVEDTAAASRTVTASVTLLALAVGVFVVYVTSTMRLLEVGWVITAVANETRAAIRRTSPPTDRYVDAARPGADAEPPRRAAEPGGPPRLPGRPRDGPRHRPGAAGRDRGSPRLRDRAASPDR